jgi:hypothetical protein
LERKALVLDPTHINGSKAHFWYMYIWNGDQCKNVQETTHKRRNGIVDISNREYHDNHKN